MFYSRVQLFISVITTHIIIPILLLLGLFLFGKGSMVGVIVYIFFTGNLVFLLFKAGNWEFTWYYVRYFFVLAFFIVSLVNLIFIYRHVQKIFNINIFIEVVVLFLSLFALYLNINVLRASIKPKNCIQLRFPFKRGRYVITDGGDGKISSLLNYHNKSQVHKKGQTNSSMRFATDIVKLDNKGFTVKNVLRNDNEQYEVFHEKVYSPCDATVLKVVDGIENNTPFSRNFPYNVGNSVVLRGWQLLCSNGAFPKGEYIGRRRRIGKSRATIGYDWEFWADTKATSPYAGLKMRRWFLLGRRRHPYFV